MVEVEVLIDNFKDRENYKKKIAIVRNNQEMELQGELFQKGDRYKISKERYVELSKLKIVAKVPKEPKKDKED